MLLKHAMPYLFCWLCLAQCPQLPFLTHSSARYCQNGALNSAAESSCRHAIKLAEATLLLYGTLRIFWSVLSSETVFGSQVFMHVLITGAHAIKASLPAAQDRGMLRSSAVPRPTADVAPANSSANSSIIACGVTSHTIDTLAPHGNTQITMSLLPLCRGVQQLSGLVVQGSSDGRVYDKLLPFEVLVRA